MMHQHRCANGQKMMGLIPCVGSLTVVFNELKKQLSQAGQAYFLPIMLVLPTLFLPNFAAAAETKVIPRLAVGTAYNDNVLLSAEDEVDSTIITVSPSLEFDYKTLLSNLSFKADLDILSYLDESDLDRTNQYYRLNGDHQIAERWTTSAELRFYRDTTLNTYLQETGRVIERFERDYFDAGGRVGYNLTNVSWISAGYRFQTASYEGDVYSDYDSHEANLYFSHRLKSELDVLYLGPSYYYRTNDLNDVDSIALNFGWKRDWSSITSSDASIGARYTNVEQNDGTEDDNWGAKAKFNMTFEGIVSTTRFNYYHDLRTTVDGDDINVDNFYLTYRRSLTERFGIGMDGRLVFSYKLLDQDSDINDERYYWLEPRLYYQLTEHLDLSLRYRYQNNVESLDDGDVTRERNIVWLQVSYGLPILL